MTYSEKLKDPRWQKKRLEILNRDNFMCQSCSETTKTLHVHHLDYEKNTDPWDYPDHYLITFCEQCHDEITEERPETEKQIIKQFRLKFHDTFMQGVFSDVIGQFPENFFYMIWEVNHFKDDLVELVHNFLLQKRDERVLLQGICDDSICAACGHKEFHRRGRVIICKLCNCMKVIELPQEV